MAGRKYPMDNVPFYWTRQFNNSLCVTGVLEGWNEVHIVGSLAEMKFTAFYLDTKNNKVMGAAVMGVPHVTQIISEAMKYGVMIKANEVK
jgi:asparagine N-glycosylation enzyme membrane subunit Stt3